MVGGWHLNMEEERALTALEVGDFDTALSILPEDTPPTLPLAGAETSLIHYACRHGNAQVLQNLLAGCKEEEITTLSQAYPNPLHIAAGRGHLAVVSLLLERGVRYQLKEGVLKATPLHWACREGHFSVVRELFNKKVCNVTDQDVNGDTPLHIACEKGHIEVVRYLLDGCSAVPQRNLLHLAVKSENVDLVKYLVQTVKIDPACLNTEDIAPVHAAAICGCIEVLRWLIGKAGCDPSMRAGPGTQGRPSGRTPLHFACIEGHFKVVKYLVDEMRCDVHDTDSKGKSVVYLASEQGSLELMQYLIKEKGCDPFYKVPDGQRASGMTPFHLASFGGNLPVVKYLAKEHGYDVNCVDTDGATPVMAAAQEGHIDTVKFLCLDLKCDVNILDKNGRSCLSYASLKGRLEMVKFLIEKCGADIEVIDIAGDTPLLIAAKGHHLPVVKYLINDSNCKLEQSTRKGHSLIHFAASYDWVDVVRTLATQKGVSPETGDSASLKPIHHAADGGAMQVLRFLIEERKCDPNSTSDNDTGWTPLLKACNSGKLEVVKYLILERHVSLKPTKNKLTSPLHLAAMDGNMQVVQFLCDNCSIERDLPDKQGATALHMAALEGHLPVVKYLVKKNFNPMARTPYDATVVHAACQGGHLEIVKYLLHECNTKLTWHDEQRPPHLRAAEHGHLEVLKYLIHNDICNVYQKDVRGLSVLHYAAAKGETPVIKFICEELGCDVIIGDHRGALPLHLACGYGQVTAAGYLLSRDPSQAMYKDMTGLTPLQHAKETNKLTEELLRVFLRHGVEPSHLEQVAPTSCGFLAKYVPTCPLVKVFFCGDAKPLLQQMDMFGVGEEHGSKTQLFSGVQPAVGSSKSFGDALFYWVRSDLVGTSGLLRDALVSCSHPVLVVGVNNACAMGEIHHIASLWLNLFASFISSSHQPLIVFAVAESAAKSNTEMSHFYSHLLSLPVLSRFNQHINPQLMYFNTSDSTEKGAGRLAALIGHFNNFLQETSVLSSPPSVLRTFIAKHFKNEIFFTLSELLTVIVDKHAPLPTDSKELAALLTSLSQAGTLVFLKNDSAVEKSWIVYEWTVFLALLHGCLVDLPCEASAPFFQQTNVIDKIRGSLDPSLLHLAACYFGHCASFKRNIDNLLFFPHLVVPRPSRIDFCVSEGEKSYGWLFHCTQGNVFSPHFYTMLPAVLALDTFPNLSILSDDSVKLWKGGGSWRTGNLSIMVDSPRVNSFIVLVKGHISSSRQLVELAKIRSSLISSTLHLMKESCPHTRTEEFIIDPASLETYTSKSSTYSMANVQELCQFMNDPTTYTLVGFDPYFIIGTELLKKLFPTNVKEAERVISQTDIELFVTVFKNHSRKLACLLRTDFLIEEEEEDEDEEDEELVRKVITEWIKRGRGWYVDLRNELDKFSIFAGRDPFLVSTWPLYYNYA